MTTTEINAELFRQLSIVAEDELLMKRVVKYLKKLTAKKQDPTQMTKEEFFAKLEKGEEEFRQGKCYKMLPDESLDEFLMRVG